jgi:hypothetical protein
MSHVLIEKIKRGGRGTGISAQGSEPKPIQAFVIDWAVIPMIRTCRPGSDRIAADLCSVRVVLPVAAWGQKPSQASKMGKSGTEK